MLNILYNVFVLPLLLAAYGIAAITNKKVRARMRGVRSSMKSLDTLNAHSQRVWFHAASMGEFEQAKPIIEELKRQQPDVQIVVSFFSPSGYTTQRDYASADAMIYVPFDTRASMRRCVQRIKPDLVVLMRYDLWWNMLHHIRRSSSNILLLNATFPSSWFARSTIGKMWYRELYSTCHTIFAVNAEHERRFRELSLTSTVQQSPDTRFDRLLEAASAKSDITLDAALQFSSTETIVVLGSVWSPDLDICLPVEKLGSTAAATTRYIIVPHEPSEHTLRDIEQRQSNTIRLSVLLKGESTDVLWRHVLVDSIGSLLKLYRYATAAYVGGGFGDGVHSLAEAAVYGVPLACGPGVGRNTEASALLAHDGLVLVHSESEYRTWISNVSSNVKERSSVLTKGAQANATYIQKRSGASKKTVQLIMQELEQRPSGRA